MATLFKFLMSKWLIDISLKIKRVQKINKNFVVVKCTYDQKNDSVIISYLQKHVDLLPHELLLLWLLVKFLPWIKCVCKAFLCQISDPIFANMLLSNGGQTQSNPIDPTQLNLILMG